MCNDFWRAKHRNAEMVMMDVRLHKDFDQMQEKQRQESTGEAGKSSRSLADKGKITANEAAAKFPLANELQKHFKNRLEGTHPMWDEGDCVKGKYKLTVKFNHGDDYQVGTDSVV